MSTTVRVPPRWLAAGNARVATQRSEPAAARPRGELPQDIPGDPRGMQVDAAERGVEFVAHPEGVLGRDDAARPVTDADGGSDGERGRVSLKMVWSSSWLPRPLRE